MYKSFFQMFTFYKNGENGDDGTVYSAEPPQDTTKLWMDTSLRPPLLKYYSDEGVWTLVNKSEIEALETRVANAEIVLDGLDGTITTKCETIVKEKVEDDLVSVVKKTSVIEQDDEQWKAVFKYSEQDSNGNVVEQLSAIKLSKHGVDVGDDQSHSRMAKDKFSIIIEGQEVTAMNKVGLETDEVYARKRIRLGDVMMIATEYGIQERWVGD